MPDPLANFISDLSAELKAQQKVKRSDDILDFIRDHWRFFVAKKYEMTNALDQLGKTVPYTVDALCDQLCMPESVYFKRSPVAQIGEAMVDFPHSALMKTFIECCGKSRHGEVCLFVVSGKHSLCITNMQTTFEPGRFICYYKSKGDLADVHVFKADDAAVRLPNMFNPER